ncbi:MAG: rod shape-determining protein MreD [Lachnospiraceae bacterium]|nr:rod shape-determining protein MreD [Lachnospiraceae bacterium]
MYVLVTFLFMFISFLLQSTLLSQFTIGDITPNLLIITVAATGLLLGRRFGMISGFIGGLVVDIFFGKVIGLYALLYMLIGYLNGLFRKTLFPGDFKLPIALIAGSDLAFGHGFYLLMFFFRGDFNYVYYLTKIILPEVIYTTIIAIFYFPVIRFVIDRIKKHEEKAEQNIV